MKTIIPAELGMLAVVPGDWDPNDKTWTAFRAVPLVGWLVNAERLSASPKPVTSEWDLSMGSVVGVWSASSGAYHFRGKTNMGTEAPLTTGRGSIPDLVEDMRRTLVPEYREIREAKEARDREEKEAATARVTSATQNLARCQSAFAIAANAYFGAGDDEREDAHAKAKMAHGALQVAQQEFEEEAAPHMEAAQAAQQDRGP